MQRNSYVTQGNINISVKRETIQDTALSHIVEQLSDKKGAVYASNYEYPGRYARWEIAFANPSLEIRFFGQRFLIQALNKNGYVVFGRIKQEIKNLTGVIISEENNIYIMGEVEKEEAEFTEEERSKQNSVFTVIRSIMNLFYSVEDDKLGLYGSFGYDIIFQFENTIQKRKERQQNQEDIVLFLPDNLYIKDQKYDQTYSLQYEFNVAGNDGKDFDKEKGNLYKVSDYKLEVKNSKKGYYADMVKDAIESFKVGDLFEVVPSHVLTQEIELTPLEVYKNVVRINPSPYNFLLSLGKEHLIGSSPEMFVRVEGGLVETCPISGTIKRGRDSLEDSDNIRTLLNSGKDEAELTMCTDVDRNDKSRICVPGSVKVIGRRQVEMYSHLIHTVDHVTGTLKDGYDGIDAFLSHMWAVTVTGAPKRAAIQWIEDKEGTPRVWYGGAVGYLAFNGTVNTGLTLRTIRLRGKIAQIRVGATLLIDSDPEAEEEETLTKAAALLASIKKQEEKKPIEETAQNYSCTGKKILIVDHEDSFVNTLGNYIRQLGADVVTMRYNLAYKSLLNDIYQFDAVVLSPGPGWPEQFKLQRCIELCIEKKLPILGICLGLQGIVEYFGGTLGVLTNPRHGIKLRVDFKDLQIENEKSMYVGLYHSLYGKEIPDSLDVIARDEEGVVMGIRHKKFPVIAVQFHPESILTSRNNNGLNLLNQMFGEIL